METAMCSFVQPNHLGPVPTAPTDSSFLFNNSVSVSPGRLFHNPNFVNDLPHIENTCLEQQPVMNNCHSDIRNKVSDQSFAKNDSLLNSSHSFLDPLEKHHMDIVDNSQTGGSRRRKGSFRIPNKVDHQPLMESDTDSVVYVTPSGTQMCPNKRKWLEHAAFVVNIPGEPSNNEQASVNIPGEPSDNEKSSVKVTGEPSYDKEASVNVTGEPSDNEKSSVNVTGEPSYDEEASVNVTGEPSDNEHAYANIPGEPSDDEASVNITGEPSDDEEESVNVTGEPSDIPGEPSDNEHASDEEDAQAIFSMSPYNCQAFKKERQLSITSSEDDFIVFEHGSDDELDEEEESEDETDSEDGNDSVEEDFDSSSPVIPCKRVRFASKEELCQIHLMIQWSFAYKTARKGPWEEYARDRARFRNRIKGMEDILVPVFDSKHRERVYKRFQNESTD